jgi:preprotein translocase SecE subunit
MDLPARSAGPAPSARENLPRPRPAPSGDGAAAKGAVRTTQAPQRRQSPFAALARLQPRFLADIIAELRKVTWPPFSEVRYLTFVVAVVAVAVGLLLGGLDLLFGWIIEQLFF